MVFLFIVAIIIVFFIVIKIRKNIYAKFVENNSVVLENLTLLNSNFKFVNNIINYNESYIYDNEVFYNNVSCEDYLIYQLQFRKYEISTFIKNVKYNKEQYAKYCDELAKINVFGVYKTSPERLRENYLIKLEKKYYKKILLNPIRTYESNITLFCSKINGRIYMRKHQVFSMEQIYDLIKRLNNKTNGFYNDRGIWDSICRVERAKVSNKMRFAIYKRDGYRCRICGRGQTFNCLEVDHIKPIAKGGKSTFNNLQTLCSRCNMEKGDKY